MAKSKLTVLEVSWEVCNKVGGIHTVLVSKMPLMLQNIDTYYAIGPYNEKNASLELVPEKPPETLSKAFETLEKKYGMKFHYGKWIIKQTIVMKKKPQAILVDPGRYRERANDIKKEMWEDFRVDTIRSAPHENDVFVWSKSVGILIEEMLKQGAIQSNSIGHFHEFLSGIAMLHLKKANAPIKSVFLTHATALGRAIAGAGKDDLYGMVNSGIRNRKTISVDKAKEYHIEDKFTLEKACALNSDVFATVSEITGRECQYMFGRKPDIILYNGLDMNKFPIMEKLSDLHIHYRDEIKKFVLGYFSPYYNTDLEDALLFFISGRFEFRNKGVDIFLDALGRLNKKLKTLKTEKKIVVFIWIPTYVKEPRHDVMYNLGIFRETEEAIERESHKIGERILKAFAKGKKPEKVEIFDPEFLFRLKETRLILDKMKGQQPPVSPFVVDDNEITESIRRNGLNNTESDPVKVIYYPTYLSASDGLLGIGYYNAMIGCHLGVFPSYYEPWGYTPLEAAALGLQTITSDLAGYGLFIRSKLKKGETSISIVHRNNVQYEESVKELENLLYDIYKAKRKERVANKIRAKQLSHLADWNNMIKNYMKAYQMALSK